MSPTGAGREGSRVFACLTVVLFFAGTAWGAAQFHLPKIPKLGKSQSAEQKKGPAGPAPELSSISPSSASPGAEGDVVLTGKNFNSGTGLRMSCGDETPSISNFKVEGPTRAVMHVKFPFEMKEGPCQLYLVQGPAGTDTTGEIAASGGGSLQITQVKSDVSFQIALSSAMPMALPVIYVGEGDLQFMEIMMKMQQAMQGSWNDAGKPQLYVSKSEVKLKKGDTAVFTEPASNVKEVGEMSMMGQNVGVFRLVCTDGKIYNFIEQESQGLPKGKTVEIIKSTLGK
jgi:hypothetical protein